MSSEASGRAVIQSPHLDIFIQQCAKKVTWETFRDKGLGLALCWYINTFSSTMCDVNFLLLCTVLDYQGDYMESVKIEIDDESGCSHHGLICRQFPLIDYEEKNIVNDRYC
jgi:hypothetical protein